MSVATIGNEEDIEAVHFGQQHSLAIAKAYYELNHCSGRAEERNVASLQRVVDSTRVPVCPVVVTRPAPAVRFTQSSIDYTEWSEHEEDSSSSDDEHPAEYLAPVPSTRPGKRTSESIGGGSRARLRVTSPLETISGEAHSGFVTAETFPNVPRRDGDGVWHNQRISMPLPQYSGADIPVAAPNPVVNAFASVKTAFVLPRNANGNPIALKDMPCPHCAKVVTSPQALLAHVKSCSQKASAFLDGMLSTEPVCTTCMRVFKGGHGRLLQHWRARPECAPPASVSIVPCSVSFVPVPTAPAHQLTITNG